MRMDKQPGVRTPGIKKGRQLCPQPDRKVVLSAQLSLATCRAGRGQRPRGVLGLASPSTRLTLGSYPRG